MNYIIPDRVYDVVKWVGLIFLPALATLVGTIGIAAGWQYTDLTVTVITAIGTFVGALVGASSSYAKKSQGGE